MELLERFSEFLAQWGVEEISQQGLLYAGLFGGILVSVAVILVFGAIFQMRTARRAQGWPVANGVVLKSEVIKGEFDNVVRYTPTLSYQYKVSERTFTNDRIAFGGTTHYGSRRAEKVRDRYAAGTPVKVYYDPADPQNSVLEIRSLAGCILFFAVLLALVGVIGALIILIASSLAA